MVDVDDGGAVALDKLYREAGGNPLERLRLPVYTAGSVDLRILVAAREIQNVLVQDPGHISVVPADETGSGQTAHHILHAGIKLRIADGLEKIVQSADIISLKYILLICGQKDDLSLIALFPYPAGDLNAGTAAELDIQKNEIKAELFFCEKVFSGGKERNRQNCRALILPFEQHFFEQ